MIDVYEREVIRRHCLKMYKESERYCLRLKYRKVEQKINKLTECCPWDASMAYQIGILKGLRMALGYAPKSKLTADAKYYVGLARKAWRKLVKFPSITVEEE